MRRILCFFGIHRFETEWNVVETYDIPDLWADGAIGEGYIFENKCHICNQFVEMTEERLF